MPDAVAPTPETADRLRHAVARLARLMRQQDDDGLGATSIGVLASVERNGPSTLGELAASARVAPPTITRIVEKLESLGLLARRVDANDRRITRVSLTKKGATYIDRTRARRTAWLAQRLADLPPDQVEHLGDAIALLETIADEAPVERP